MSIHDELLSADEAHRLWKWALGLLEQPGERQGIRTTQDDTDLCGNALVLAAYAATQGSDFRWVADVPRVLELVAAWMMDNTAPRWEQALRSLALLLDARAPIDRRVERLAKSPDARVRRQLADGLHPGDPKALALLERLVRDPDRSTRMKAEQKLPETKVSPWWFGAFEADPIPRVDGGPPSEAIVTALRTVADFADLPHELRMGKQEAFEPALAELPPTLRFEFADRFLSWDWAPDYGQRVVAVLARTREGQLALWDIVTRRFRSRQEYQVLSVLQVYVDALAKETRKDLLATWLERGTCDARPVSGPMIELLSYVMRSAWPTGGDPTPVLDAWERLMCRDESGLLATGLVGAIEHADLSEPRIFARIVPLAEQHKQLVSVLERSLHQVDDVTAERSSNGAWRAAKMRFVGSRVTTSSPGSTTPTSMGRANTCSSACGPIRVRVTRSSRGTTPPSAFHRTCVKSCAQVDSSRRKPKRHSIPSDDCSEASSGHRSRNVASKLANVQPSGSKVAPSKDLPPKRNGNTADRCHPERRRRMMGPAGARSVSARPVHSRRSNERSSIGRSSNGASSSQTRTRVRNGCFSRSSEDSSISKLQT